MNQSLRLIFDGIIGKSMLKGGIKCPIQPFNYINMSVVNDG